VAFSSRKRHLSPPPKGHVNSGTALEAVLQGLKPALISQHLRHD
jgi:hypothetical protein